MGIFKITRYRLSLEKCVETIGDKLVNRLALINCFGSNINTDLIRWANISFIQETEVLPPDTITKYGANQFDISMYFPASCYPWFVDLLRNEEPIALDFGTDATGGLNYCRIRTGSDELPGEGE